MKQVIRIALLLAAAGFSTAGHAACSCTCVNGQVQAICESAIDLRPICSPQICPLVPPSIAPLQTPMVPPVGTSHCRQVQAIDRYSGQYQWRTVCQ